MTNPTGDIAPLIALVVCVLVTIAVAALIQIIDAAFDADDPRCPSRYASRRCVHDQDHPGSHRDEHGEYWN